MKKIIKNHLPIFFIIFIWLIFSSPYLFKNKVPYPSTYQVNWSHPWSSYEKFWGPVKNGAMPDIIGEIYPWRHFTIQAWGEGQIPFWNPYSFSGNPHIANYQSAVFSPFNLIFFLLPFIDAWSILVLLQPLLAGIFTYLLAREFKISKQGSLVSSIVFMFCGFMVVWMAYGTLSMAITFLPLAIFLIEKNFNKLSLTSLFFLSLVVLVSFFSGHFQTSLYFLILSLSFFIFKTLKTKRLKEAFFVFFALAMGIVVSLIQIIPSIQLYLNSVRSGIFVKGGGIPFYYFVNIFSPDFFGNPVTRNDWFGFYAEWASFIGIIPLVLVVFAMFRKRNALSIFFFFAGIASLLLALDTPLQMIIGNLKIPVLSTSNPSRIIVLFSFSFAILAGFGLDNLKELMNRREFKKIKWPFLLITLILLLTWVIIMFFKPMPADKLLIAKRNLVLPTSLFIGAFLFVLLSFFHKKIILFAMVKPQALLIYFLLFAISFDSLRFAQKWMPFDPKELVFVNLPVITEIKKHIGVGRIFGNFGAQVDTYYNFPSIEGYDPLYIERYGQFIRAAGRGEFLEAERSVVRLARDGEYTDRVLDLLGVTILFHPIADTNQVWAYPVWKDKERFLLVFQDDKFQLFRNKTAMDRATLFYNYEVIEKKEDIIKKFYSKDFDFRNTLLLEEDPGLMPKNSKSDKKNGRAQIISYAPNKVQIKVVSSSPALLFLSDNFYPGWEAKVNGIKAKIYRADYSFRAIVVPEGESIVEFKYGAFF